MLPGFIRDVLSGNSFFCRVAEPKKSTQVESNNKHVSISDVTSISEDEDEPYKEQALQSWLSRSQRARRTAVDAILRGKATLASAKLEWDHANAQWQCASLPCPRRV